MRNAAVLALGALREALRDRLLYALILLGAVILLVLAMMSPLSLGARDKTFHDAGLAWIHASGLLTLLVLGAWSLHRERERGIWTFLLTRPLRRQEYLLGRIGGLLAVLFVTLLAVGFVYLLVGLLVGISPLAGLPQAMLYVFMEMSLLAGLIIFFSTFTGFAMTVLMALMVFVAGHLATDLLRFAVMLDQPLVNGLTTGLHWLLPHMEIYRIRQEVVGATPGLGAMLPVFGYTLLYLTALMSLAAAIFSRREIR